MSCSMVDDGTNPPVAIVLIERDTLSSMSGSPTMYRRTAMMTTYTVNMTVMVPNSSFMRSVLPAMKPRMDASLRSG